MIVKIKNKLYLGISLLLTILTQVVISAPHDSNTLPLNLRRNDYFHYIAHELDWHTLTDNLCHGYFEEPPEIADYPDPGQYTQLPTTITADGPTLFKSKGVSVLSKNVVVTQLGRKILADKAFIYQDAKSKTINKIILIGHVRLLEAGKLTLSDRASLILNPQKVTMEHVLYRFNQQQWGSALKASNDQNKISQLQSATYSTCDPRHPTWQLSAKQIILDKQKNIGRAYNAVLRFFNVPFLYLPYYSFPLNKERKTGWLTPQARYSKASGASIAFPYYLNIAPNKDWLLTPEYYSNRNFRLSSLFRYLTANSRGELYLSYFPHDAEFKNFQENALSVYSNTSLYSPQIYDPYLKKLAQYNSQRAFFSMVNHSDFSPQLRLRVFLNDVTDPYYFADNIENYAGDSTSNQLLNLFQLTYSGYHWQWNFYGQHYQTLHLITQIQDQNQALDPYTRLPAFETSAYYPDIFPHSDFALESNLTRFDFDNSFFASQPPTGNRLHIRPGFSFQSQTAGAFIKPEVWLDSTTYQLDHLTPGLKQYSSRNLPIFDIDTGLIFERRHLFTHYKQTLEPRLFYLYIPYQNQDDYPNFDSFLLPFYFEQLFALNNFTGYDRLDNANQMSLALTSRLIDETNGQNILSANLGVIDYFTSPQVCTVPYCSLAKTHFSPILANLNFYPNPHLSLSGTLAWDPSLQSMNNAQANLIYRADGYHLFSLGYAFVRAQTALVTPLANQPANFASVNSSYATFGLAWPLTRRWSIVGYSDYNISLSRLDSYYTGLKFENCCWAVQFIVKRSFNASAFNDLGQLANQYDNAYFVTLSLKGLGDLGTMASTKLLTSTLPGYNRW